MKNEIVISSPDELSALQHEVMGLFNDLRRGGFISIRGYEPKGGPNENFIPASGEPAAGDKPYIANYIVQHAIYYKRLVEADLADLFAGRVATQLKELGILTIPRWAYRDESGELHQRSAKGREHVYVPDIYDLGFEPHLNEVYAALGVIAAAMDDPAPATAQYKPVAAGVGKIQDTPEIKHEPGILHLRNCLFVSKTIVQDRGIPRPQKCSRKDVALREWIRARLLRVGRYRCFCLDGRFDEIRAGGFSIVQDFLSPYEMALVADMPATQFAEKELV